MSASGGKAGHANCSAECPLITQSGHFKLFGSCHSAELDEHPKLISADPFFCKFSVANAEHCKRRPGDHFAFCHRVTAKSARPVSAPVHYVVQSPCSLH